ncbi:TP53-binding protein 1-like [Liolophura sinensis]|uniref:TP53-binding protein 1-like n=1 Tax=Liolophura sinensis TaxID=3198878 RepID=UPI003158B694
MECSKRNALAGLAVSVVSLSADFRDAWVSILQTAGCVVTSQLSTEVTVDKDLGVVVTDCTCPKSFIVKSELANVPVVSTEWVIQCLIRGEFVDTRSHPRYHPHYLDR